jgi:hypothetical protein
MGLLHLINDAKKFQSAIMPRWFDFRHYPLSSKNSPGHRGTATEDLILIPQQSLPSDSIYEGKGQTLS